MSRMIARTWVLGGVAALALGVTGCGATDNTARPTKAPPTKALPTQALPTKALPAPTAVHTVGAAAVRTVGPTATVPAPGVLAIAIVTKMDSASVSWTDGQFVHTEAGGQLIQPLDGAEHQHTAPLADHVTLLGATGCGSTGGAHVDQKGLGTISCTLAQFIALVVGHANASPAMTFNEHGQVTRMAARHQP